MRCQAICGAAASNEIQLVVNTPLPPSAPAALLGMVNGSKLALSWTNTFQGGAPTALQLNVTGAQTATIPLAMSDTMSFDGVPGGTYSFTLTASNAGGVSPPSNAVTLTFPGSCSGPPGIPIDFAVAKSGSTLTLTWNPPVSGAAVTSYVIHASGTITASLPTVAAIGQRDRRAGHVCAERGCGQRVRDEPAHRFDHRHRALEVGGRRSDSADLGGDHQSIID